MIFPLRQKRFESQISQHLLSCLTGIPQSRLSLFERGLAIPREDEKKKIAKALKVQVKQIFPNDTQQLA